MLEVHVLTECSAKKLLCKHPECNVNVFREYAGSRPLHQSVEHSCVRDNYLIRFRVEIRNNMLEEENRKLKAELEK